MMVNKKYTLFLRFLSDNSNIILKNEQDKNKEDTHVSVVTPDSPSLF